MISLSTLLLAAVWACTAGLQAQETSLPFENYQSGFHSEVLVLQTLLDRQHLSGNCADGVWGPRTEIALLTWQILNDLPATGVPDASVLDALGGSSNVLTRYTITTNDLANLGPVPSDWEGRSQMLSLPYETLQELLAEKGHVSQGALEQLNPDAPWPNPPAGSEVILPEHLDKKLPQAGSIRISLSRMEIVVYNTDGALIALFPCSIAAQGNRRLAGEFTVQVVAPNPNYTYDPQLFRPGGEKTAKLIIPPGPNNPVGLAWIGLSQPGYGIHGTPVPERIGRAESKGCFRLANWNAVKLLQMVSVGTPVIVEE